MKWVYMALINGKVSAFHKKESVIKDYLKGYKSSNPMDDCYIAKTKRDSVESISDYSDLYLTEVDDDVYIQQKYEDVFCIFFMDNYNHDINEMKEDIMNLLFNGRCSKKQKKKLLSSLNLLDDIEDSGKKYFIPSLRQLQEDYWKLEEYRNNTIYE